MMEFTDSTTGHDGGDARRARQSSHRVYCANAIGTTYLFKMKKKNSHFPLYQSLSQRYSRCYDHCNRYNISPIDSKFVLQRLYNIHIQNTLKRRYNVNVFSYCENLKR